MGGMDGDGQRGGEGGRRRGERKNCGWNVK